ncbi:MAG: hypothetical protein ACRDX8_05580 [Acidimicrobiales bacterium]
MCSAILALLVSDHVTTQLAAASPTGLLDLAAILGYHRTNVVDVPFRVTPTLHLGRELASPADVVVVDDGPLQLTAAHPEIGLASNLPRTRRDRCFVVLRGPSYLGLRTLARFCGAGLDGIILLEEAGRAIGPGEVEAVTRLAVVGTLAWDSRLATVIDAGLLPSCLPGLHQVAGLHGLVKNLCQSLPGSYSNSSLDPALCFSTTATRSASEPSRSGLNTG